MSTAKLIERLTEILPGIQNSNSAAEDAMVEVLPEVIAKLQALTAERDANADSYNRTLEILSGALIEVTRLKAERDAMAEALAEAASELQVCFEALGEFANTLSHEPYEANRAYSAMSDARKALESSK